MRIAITGSTGRVGAELVRHLAAQHEIIPLPHAVCDLADSASLKPALDSLECDVFINPAALTNLETCEDDPRLAMRVNSAAPGKIAIWAAERGVRMIHLSTDYVFDGEGSVPLTETMRPAPLSAYGRSKLAGEQAVLTHPGNLVLRVAWVFGPDKPSFVDQIFDDALAGKPLSAVADKFSLPTCTTDLAHWISALLETDASGLLHACNPGEAVSWHGMAEFVVREMTAFGVLESCPEVAALKLDEISFFRARRPRFTVMGTTRLSSMVGDLRPWPVALAEHVKNRCSSATETAPAP
ncbi:MAG: dTDP-4-dehydrorhamnose reductase [Verrucomicrobiaceae bacterium]|nr:MAG: dTDP-4-dehydrorhamnose reductase [Verrucomicrobiaceae bacterium]